MLAITRHRNRAFSLIELVIVVVIIGIIAAIAIPRMSRGATGASESTLTGNLAVLRKAIDLYSTEHGGSYPPAASFKACLEQYTTSDGATPDPKAAKDATHIYGPYLRVVPKLNVGPVATQTDTINTVNDNSGGWFYDATTGEIKANIADKDSKGVSFSAY